MRGDVFIGVISNAKVCKILYFFILLYICMFMLAWTYFDVFHFHYSFQESIQLSFAYMKNNLWNFLLILIAMALSTTLAIRHRR